MARTVGVYQLNDTNGTLISVYTMDSAAVRYTEGVNTERGLGRAAMWLSGVGTIAVARQVSIDNTNFYTPYDQAQVPSSTLFTIHAAGSAGVFLLHTGESSSTIAPWTRFSFTTIKGGVIHGVSFLQEE